MKMEPGYILRLPLSPILFENTLDLEEIGSFIPTEEVKEYLVENFKLPLELLQDFSLTVNEALAFSIIQQEGEELNEGWCFSGKTSYLGWLLNLSTSTVNNCLKGLSKRKLIELKAKGRYGRYIYYQPLKEKGKEILIPKILFRSREICPIAAFLYGYLYFLSKNDYYKEPGCVQFSGQQFAEDFHIARSSVAKYFSILNNLGLVEIYERPSKVLIIHVNKITYSSVVRKLGEEKSDDLH